MCSTERHVGNARAPVRAFVVYGGWPMPPLSAAFPDPSVHTGHLARYSCRTVDEIDQHLAYLAKRLRAAEKPQAWRMCREDVDALIDRRLQLMQQEAPP